VLNAKFHEKEAEIIAQAGQAGSVTIATNMAGRGTDIVLGGNFEAEIKALKEPDPAKIRSINSEWQKHHEEVVANGGLRIIGTERHESRRIDNQLRGRAGRQGDPGSSRFYLSLEDNLMRIFASEKVAMLMQKLGMEESEAIESNLVSRAIENAQKKVEAHNFDIRKHLLEFDDVANDQRKVVYEWRNELLDTEDISTDIYAMRESLAGMVLDTYIPHASPDELWDIPGLTEALEHQFSVRLTIAEWLAQDDDLHEEVLRDKIMDCVNKSVAEKEEIIPPELMRRIEKDLTLEVLDRHWKEHIVAMDQLRQGIGLRGYAAKNPKQEYKREAFGMFNELLSNIKNDIIGILSKVQIRPDQDVDSVQRKLAPKQQQMSFNHPAAPNALAEPEQESATSKTPFVREQRKIGRNEPCPCGSGKKYKLCHGKLG